MILMKSKIEGKKKRNKSKTQPCRNSQKKKIIIQLFNKLYK